MITKYNRNKRFGLLLVLMLALLSVACSEQQKSHIVIKLKDGHLESLPMGSWLTFFNFDYSEGAEHLKIQAVVKLQAEAKLIDQYVYEDGGNKVGARSWDWNGVLIKEEYYRGGEWEGPKVFDAQAFYKGGPAENLWITIEFEKGIPYSELIPQQNELLNPIRTMEHSVTVESERDQGRRLFLFGYGPLCKRISLF